jgi:hypothetical protein
MNFADHLLKLLKRIATIDVAHASTDINDDGVFELEVIAILDEQIAPICSITENATKVELTQFELQLDLLENALVAQSREDAENAAKVHEILSRLTKEERELIERPLPEDNPTVEPSDPDFCEYL